jgi:DegV family protein with EDD domain
MKTAIITDSNSGISPAEAKELGIYVLPMPVIIDGQTRFEGIDLDEEEFYNLLTSGHDVTTSQPSPGDVLDLWDQLLEEGYDAIVHIPMSSGLSASCETALGLAADYDGRVCVVDNHRISITLRISVLEAKMMADKGIPAREIKEDIEKRGYESSIYIGVDSLTYLKKGGRITPAAAALGTVLNLKPVLTIQGGKLDAFAKVRGMKKGKARMVEALVNDYHTRFPDADLSRLRVGAAGAGLTKEEAESWRQEIADAFPGVDVYYDPLSISIGTHVGPGSYGMGISVLGDKAVD